jgi:cytochrome c oxidase assembly protein subunit 15
VVFGAYVRLTAAGLGCPDWPGCYGHFMPADSLPEAGKAWREMIHRYAASTLGLIIVVIAALAMATRKQRIVRLGYALALPGIVVLQGMLGMLTVTWSLKPPIVTLHLLFGLTTLSLLWWMWLSLREKFPQRPIVRFSANPLRTHKLVLIALIALGVQIGLGGWTSSNYAAVACPDLPKCQGEWWPATDYQDAFVLWRGLGVNYEGGVLEHPARAAIHLTHRLGAIVASFALLWTAITVLRKPLLAPAQPAAIAVLLALVLQLSIGTAMVLAAFPLSLATAHNAGAALLLLATLALYRQTARFG